MSTVALLSIIVQKWRLNEHNKWILNTHARDVNTVFFWQLIHLLLSLSQHYYSHNNIPYHKLSTHYNLLSIGISLYSLNTVYRKPMKEIGRRLHSVLYLIEWFSYSSSLELIHFVKSLIYVSR